IGAQRPALSSEYYEVFNRANVALVTTPIREITATAVVTDDGQVHPAETLILATGYATHKFLSAINVLGRHSVALHDQWAQGAYAYLGITVENFPNLFMLYGPNTNIGSIITALETQTDYIVRKILYILEKGIDALEVNASVVAAYNERLQARIL